MSNFRNNVKKWLGVFILALSIIHTGRSNAQMLIKNSGENEVVRVTQEGRLGIGANTPAAKLAVAGNAIIGENWASISPAPVNGLAVEKSVTIGQANASPIARMEVYGFERASGDDLARGILSQLESEVPIPDNLRHFAIGGTSHITSTDATPGTRMAVHGQIIDYLSGAPVYLTAGRLGYFQKSPNMPVLSGLHGYIHSVDASWSPLASSYKRAALFLQNGNSTVLDWGAFVVADKNYFSGKVAIGTTDPQTFDLAVNGTAAKTGGGSWSSYSDMRLKQVSGNFSRGLDEIAQLEVIRFHYQADNPMEISSAEEWIGLSAQQVNELIPEAVQKDRKGYLLLNNDPILFAMLNAIKELKAKNEELEKRLDSMRP